MALGQQHLPWLHERRNWHEGCLRTGAMIATRRGQERAGAGGLCAGNRADAWHEVQVSAR
jgi:hypothetical protein